MIYEIKSSELTAQINSLGAELISVVDSKGNQYIYQPSDVWVGQAKNLFPNVGVAKDDYGIIKGERYPIGQHGFLKTTELDAVQLSDSEVEFTMLSNVFTYAKFPYHYKVKINFKLDGNKLTQGYTVVNQEDGDLHFGIACHTGFCCDSESILHFGNTEKLTELLRPGMNYLSGEEVDYLTPNGKLTMGEIDFSEGGHILKGYDQNRVVLENTKLKTKVEFEFKDFNYMTLWGLPQADDFICLMPWCALPDYDDTNHIFEEKRGNITLKKSEVFRANQYFTFSPL